MKIQKTIGKFDDIVVGQIVENEVNWSTHEEDSVDKTQQVMIQEGSLWTKTNLHLQGRDELEISGVG